MESSLGREDWMRAARLALLREGVAGVRVEKLARDLGVTKGSFYWHFADRPALLEALIGEWEAEADLLIGATGARRDDGLRALIEALAHRVRASERGEVPSDAAIFAWAAVAPEIASRVSTAEEERIGLLAALMGDPGRAETAYMAYLGYILRRRHGPDPETSFRRAAALFFPASRPERPATSCEGSKK